MNIHETIATIDTMSRHEPLTVIRAAERRLSITETATDINQSCLDLVHGVELANAHGLSVHINIAGLGWVELDNSPVKFEIIENETGEIVAGNVDGFRV